MNETICSGTETVPADDRGLAYGDGLFETMRAADGGIPLLGRHLDRLLAGCRRLGIPPPARTPVAARASAAAEAMGKGVVKLIVTRGSGGRGYRPPVQPRPRILLSMHQLPAVPDDWYRSGVILQVCSTRMSRSAATAGLKTLGRLEQVLASAELEPGVVDGLMLDEHGNFIEATRCNLFLCEAGSLVTPRLDMSGVAGVMRSVVFELAREQGIPVGEHHVDLERLQRADEIFLTNAVLGLLPAIRVVGTDWRGEAGRVTRGLMRAAADLGVAEWAP